MALDLLRAAAQQSSFSRRAFLRGVGVGIALPLFDSLGGKLLADAPAARLAMTPGGAPLRTAFVYFPNGAIPSQWWPAAAGTDFQFSRTLQPLQALRSNLQ